MYLGRTMNIIAIGGGSLKKKETLKIDRFIVGLSKKSSPRALFIPTANNDSEEYCRTFDHIYGDLLGCRTEHLLLYRRPADRTAAAAKIRAADIIYVGGGNTLRMMTFWRKLGIDRLLEQAARQGTILAGLSAGAICWYQWGHSDSRSYAGKKKWSYIKVTALGIIPGLFCPHLDGEKRHRSFKVMVEKERVQGIACDNNAAVWFHDGTITCIASRHTAGVHIYSPVKDRVVVRTFRNNESIELPG